ncbi:MAG: hypothetical protein ACKVQJ_06185 [Pyrinomonadaceae bacterium]
MTLLDFLIIYFAAGAPFGVYQITTLDGDHSVSAFFHVVLQIVLWPVFVISKLIDHFRTVLHPSASNRDRYFDRVCSEIESLAFVDSSAAAVFDFRETLFRYTGLSGAVNSLPAESCGGGFSEIFPAENRKLAAVCLVRRDRAKLVFHHAVARNDFVGIVSEIANDRPEILKIAVQLAARVDDRVAVEDLGALTRRDSSSVRHVSLPIPRVSNSRL